MEIPFDLLSAEALRGLILEFVSRDGTDYGEVEVEEAQKVRRVESQLRSGEVVIVYDAPSDSCNIITREAARAVAR